MGYENILLPYSKTKPRKPRQYRGSTRGANDTNIAQIIEKNNFPQDQSAGIKHATTTSGKGLGRVILTRRLIYYYFFVLFFSQINYFDYICTAEKGAKRKPPPQTRCKKRFSWRWGERRYIR